MLAAAGFVTNRLKVEIIFRARARKVPKTAPQAKVLRCVDLRGGGALFAGTHRLDTVRGGNGNREASDRDERLPTSFKPVAPVARPKQVPASPSQCVPLRGVDGCSLCVAPGMSALRPATPTAPTGRPSESSTGTPPGFVKIPPFVRPSPYAAPPGSSAACKSPFATPKSMLARPLRTDRSAAPRNASSRQSTARSMSEPSATAAQPASGPLAPLRRAKSTKSVSIPTAWARLIDSETAREEADRSSSTGGWFTCGGDGKGNSGKWRNGALVISHAISLATTADEQQSARRGLKNGLPRPAAAAATASDPVSQCRAGAAAVQRHRRGERHEKQHAERTSSKSAQKSTAVAHEPGSVAEVAFAASAAVAASPAIASSVITALDTPTAPSTRPSSSRMTIPPGNVTRPPARNPLTGGRAESPRFSRPKRGPGGVVREPRTAVSAWKRDAVQAACPCQWEGNGGQAKRGFERGAPVCAGYGRWWWQRAVAAHGQLPAELAVGPPSHPQRNISSAPVCPVLHVQSAQLAPGVRHCDRNGPCGPSAAPAAGSRLECDPRRLLRLARRDPAPLTQSEGAQGPRDGGAGDIAERGGESGAHAGNPNGPAGAGERETTAAPQQTSLRKRRSPVHVLRCVTAAHCGSPGHRRPSTWGPSARLHPAPDRALARPVTDEVPSDDGHQPAVAVLNTIGVAVPTEWGAGLPTERVRSERRKKIEQANGARFGGGGVDPAWFLATQHRRLIHDAQVRGWGRSDRTHGVTRPPLRGERETATTSGTDRTEDGRTGKSSPVVLVSIEPEAAHQPTNAPSMTATALRMPEAST